MEEHRKADIINRVEAPSSWHETTFADAILDRIVHNARRLELDGPSMRKIEADKNRPATIDQEQGK